MNPFSNMKVFRQPERLSEWMRTGMTTVPVGFDLDLTNRCPHSCPKCLGEWRQDPTAELSRDEAIRFARELRQLGAVGCNFTGGGEPLAHPDAGEVIAEITALGLSTGLITNGSCIKQHDRDLLLDNLTWLRVSLDALTPERYAKVHGTDPGEFNRVLDGVKWLCETHRSQRKSVVGVGILTDEDMRDAIVPVAGLVKSLGADYVQFRPFDTSYANVNPEIEEARLNFESRDFEVQYNRHRYAAREREGKGYKVCHGHHFWTIINANAEVQICCDKRGPEGRLGNLREQTFREIWFGRRRQDVMRSLNLDRCPRFCRMNSSNLALAEVALRLTDEEHL